MSSDDIEKINDSRPLFHIHNVIRFPFYNLCFYLK